MNPPALVTAMLSSAPRQFGQRSRSATRMPTVCIVDPQLDDYQDWIRLAKARGIRLEMVDSAADALRLSRTIAVDLWVINTSLPCLSGYELCEMLESRHTG